MGRKLLALGLLLLGLGGAGGCKGLHAVGEAEHRHLIARAGAAPGDLVATFFATSLGDATLLELPSGRTLLVDAGCGWQVDSILSYLRARGITRLDGLLLSHPHWDHYGGMREVVERVPVGVFYTNGHGSDAAVYRRLEEALRERGVPTQVLRRGDALDALTGPGARIEVLYPDAFAFGAAETENDANDASLVLRVTHGTQRLLLTGDCEWSEEERLLQLEGTRLKADVLKLGHHASVFSGKPEFLRTVAPRLAIAQGTQGVNVPLFFPRPSSRICDTLRAMGVPLRSTDIHGALQVVSTGASIRWRTLFGPHLPRNGSIRLSRSAPAAPSAG